MRRDQQRLNDMLGALDWIAKAVSGRTEADFLADEAVARLSPELTGRHSSVPWPDIVGLRNILVHEYFGIYWPFVWQTAVDHSPVLREQIAEILSAEFPE